MNKAIKEILEGIYAEMIETGVVEDNKSACKLICDSLLNERLSLI